MTSDHLRSPHPWGADAECPGCRETCHCENLVEIGYPIKTCVHCRLTALGLKP